MRERLAMGVGIVAGIVWALCLVCAMIGAGLPYIAAPVAMPTALFVPGLVLMLMIARLAYRRFFDESRLHEEPQPGSGFWIDQRVLSNTVEQVILSLITWPFIAVTLGGAVVIGMGVGFAIARLLFWIGYHFSRPLRAFGFAAGFYPTIFASIWSCIVWLS